MKKSLLFLCAAVIGISTLGAGCAKNTETKNEADGSKASSADEKNNTENEQTDENNTGSTTTTPSKDTDETPENKASAGVNREELDTLKLEIENLQFDDL